MAMTAQATNPQCVQWRCKSCGRADSHSGETCWYCDGTMGVTAEHFPWCSGECCQPALKEREIEDHGNFGVFWYRRPTGHTKTGARHRFETPMVTEWAVVPRATNHDGWQVGRGTPGFKTRAAAIAHGAGAC